MCDCPCPNCQTLQARVDELTRELEASRPKPPKAHTPSDLTLEQRLTRAKAARIGDIWVRRTDGLRVEVLERRDHFSFRLKHLDCRNRLSTKYGTYLAYDYDPIDALPKKETA